MLCCLMSYIRMLSECITTLLQLCGILMTMCMILIPVIIVLLFIIRFLVQKRAKSLLPQLRTISGTGKKPVIIGFFHPYCNAGGGGERVLWTAIRALQNKYEHVRCVVYTGDTDATSEEILSRAQQRFNITLPRTGGSQLQFVFLDRRKWVKAKPYPVLTLLGQSLGSLALGFEALIKFVPDVYLDTMGYAFTLPLFKYLGGCKVGCYVHYPTISTDMLQKVSDRTESFNNASVISRSPTLSLMKLIYYKIFAFAYGSAGKCSDVIMVNSTWTYGHICEIWASPGKTNIVYPPCDVTEFLKIPVADDSHKQPQSIVSLGQFRPEKDHPLQIKSFSVFLDMVPDERDRFMLILVGGCRNSEDEDRVKNLKQLCKELNVENAVEFRLNVSFTELKRSLEESTIGLHTMWNEHFGIGVVECMAAGTVMLAHNSGGPKLDIVKDYNDQKTGFLASDVQSYAEAMRDIFHLSPSERTSIRTNARESITRFSEEEFESGFLANTESMLG